MDTENTPKFNPPRLPCDVVGLIIKHWVTQKTYTIRVRRGLTCTACGRTRDPTDHNGGFIPGCNYDQEVVLEVEVQDLGLTRSTRIRAAKNFRLVCKSVARTYGPMWIYRRIGGSIFRRQYLQLMRVNAVLSTPYLKPIYAQALLVKYTTAGRYISSWSVYYRIRDFNTDKILSALIEHPMRILDSASMSAITSTEEFPRSRFVEQSSNIYPGWSGMMYDLGSSMIHITKKKYINIPLDNDYDGYSSAGTTSTGRGNISAVRNWLATLQAKEPRNSESRHVEFSHAMYRRNHNNHTRNITRSVIAGGMLNFASLYPSTYLGGFDGDMGYVLYPYIPLSRKPTVQHIPYSMEVRDRKHKIKHDVKKTKTKIKSAKINSSGPKKVRAVHTQVNNVRMGTRRKQNRR